MGFFNNDANVKKRALFKSCVGCLGSLVDVDRFVIRSLSLLVIVIVLSFFFLLGNEIITHFIQIYCVCVCVCLETLKCNLLIVITLRKNVIRKFWKTKSLRQESMKLEPKRVSNNRWMN